MTHERRVPMEPPIALERPVKKELEKGDYLTYKLRNDPADAQSPGYDLTIPYFRDGTPEQFLRFRKNLQKVFAGQNVTDGPNMFTIGRRLMDGDALSHFENFVTAEGLTQTVNNFNRAMEAVGKHVFPAQAAKLQKRYLRRFVRKPMGMTSRMFVARVQDELNNYLPHFPSQVPGEPIQKLDDDEIIDLMEFGVPRSWQKKMEEHNFDSTNTTIGEFLAFCERMERIETMDNAKSGGGGRPDQGGGRAGKTNDLNRKRKADVATRKFKGDKTYHCLYHGENNTHSTDECYLVKKEVRLMKDRPSTTDVPRKKDYAKKQELNAFNKTSKSSGQRAAKRARPDPKAEHIEELKNFEEMSLSDESPGEVAIKTEYESDDTTSTF